MFKKHVAVLTSIISDEAIASGASRVHLLPCGYFESIDGRPGNVAGVTAQKWRLTMEDAWPLITALANKKTSMLCDYEHQTLLAEKNGLPAPAAGWCKKLEWVDGQGLFATDVQWTDKAKAHLKAGEYKYISPVFLFDKDTGAVTDLKHFALTNDPGLDCLQPLVAALSQRFSLDPSLDPKHNLPKELPMNRILAALGLVASATEDTALTALSTLQGQAAQATGKDAEIAALKANQFDPTKHIPLSEHTKVAEQLAALKATADAAEQETLVTAALADCRILPANEAYWRGQPLAVLTAFLKDAKPLVALKGMQTNGKAPDGDPTKTSLSAEELAVCKTTGLTPEQFTAAKGA
jgi:phage I-like protein